MKQPDYVNCDRCGKPMPVDWRGWSGERGKHGWSPDELGVIQQAEERHEEVCR